MRRVQAVVAGVDVSGWDVRTTGVRRVVLYIDPIDGVGRQLTRSESNSIVAAIASHEKPLTAEPFMLSPLSTESAWRVDQYEVGWPWPTVRATASLGAWSSAWNTAAPAGPSTAWSLDIAYAIATWMSHAGLWFLLMFTLWFCRAFVRWKRRLCIQCGYDLRHTSPLDNCPECGRLQLRV